MCDNSVNSDQFQSQVIFGFLCIGLAMASPFEKREAEPDSEAENGYAESEAEDDSITDPEDPYAESESEPEIDYYGELDVKGE